MYYDEGDLADPAHEGGMEIWKHNGSWYQMGWYTSKGIDTIHNEIWANITDFGSIFAPLQDTTPPVITGDSGNVGVGTGDTVTLWVTGTDNIGVTSASVSTDGGPPAGMTWNAGNGRWEHDYTASSGDDSDHTYNLTIYDAAGNSDSSGPYNIVVTDNDPPVITNVIDIPDPQKSGGSVNIACVVTDNINVSVVKAVVTYPDSTIVNATMSGGSYYYNTTYTASGTYTYFIWANDTQGNGNTSATYSFVIDATPPEILNMMDIPDPQESGGEVTITCEVTDNVGVKVVKVNITYPDGSMVNETMNIGSYYHETIYTALGIYEYFLWAVDTAGNTKKSSIHSFVVKQSEPPWSWLTVSLDPDGYIQQASTFYLHADDNVGPWRIHYRVDGGDEKIGDWDKVVHFQINKIQGYEPGEHIIEYWAVDAVGNEEVHHVEVYVLDTRGPTTSMSFEGICEVTRDAQYQITPLTLIKFDAVDNGCGVAGIYYRIDDGDWVTYSEPFVVSEEGEYGVYYYATDRMGNAGGGSVTYGVVTSALEQRSWRNVLRRFVIYAYHLLNYSCQSPNEHDVLRGGGFYFCEIRCWEGMQ